MITKNILKYRPMKTINVLLFLFLGIVCYSCSSQEDSTAFGDIKSDEANLLSITVEYEKSTYECTISGTEIFISRPLPNGATEVTIKSLTTSYDATSDKKTGDQLEIGSDPSFISVTAENGSTTQTYTLNVEFTDYVSIVQKHGALKVNGNKIVDKNNESISLAGNSFFWSNDNWGGERYYKSSVVSWLKLDWNTSIVRAAMGVDETGGYLDNKTSNLNRVKIIVDAAIKEGIFVIIDWHSHHAEDYTDEAVAFFKEMAQLYGKYDNIIYEIYNEPLDVSWDKVIKPYAETVIATIRAIDPDNLIVVGTPEWDQRVDLAAANPITKYSNIAYVLHFYTIYHGEWLRGVADEALNKGIPIFVTEWGSVGYTQNDPETEKWMDWCKKNSISHCSWAVNDKDEEWSILKPNTNTNGFWDDTDLTESGKLSRSIIRNWGE